MNRTTAAASAPYWNIHRSGKRRSPRRRRLPALCAAFCAVLCLTGCGVRPPVTPERSGPSLPGQAAGVRDGETLLTAEGTAIPAWRALYWLTLACDGIREQYQSAGQSVDWTAPADENGGTVGSGGTGGNGNAVENGGADGNSGTGGVSGGTGSAFTLADYAKARALSDAVLYAQVEALAARCGVELDAEDETALEERWQSQCAQHGGEAEFLRVLSRFGLDREKSMELYRTGRLYGKLCALCYADGSASDGSASDSSTSDGSTADSSPAGGSLRKGGLIPDAEQYAALERSSGQIRFDRILAAAGNDKNAAKTKAAAYFVRLNGAADQAALFAELAAQGDDPSGPRTLWDGTLDAALSSALRALEIGQLSGIVENGEGFSILRRLPPERGTVLEAWVEGTLAASAETARVEASAAWRALDAGAFAEKLEELRAGIS